MNIQEKGPNNESNPDVELSEGERWLELLDKGHLKGTLIPYFMDDRQLKAEEFPLLCGEHARPSFVALERLSPEHPKRQEYINALGNMLNKYLPEPEDQ